MANYVKQTWTDSVSQTTAARMGFMETGILDAHFQPTCRAHRSTTLSVVTATETDVPMLDEDWDLIGGAASTQHSTSSNQERLVAQVAGKYRVSGQITYAANATGERYCLLYKNTSQYASPLAGNLSAGVTQVQVGDVVDLAVNDYVKLRAYQTSGGNLNVTAAVLAFERVG